MVSDKDIQRAAKRGAKLHQMVQHVAYDPSSDKIELVMSWCTIKVDRRHIDEFRDVSPEAMKTIYSSAMGVHIDELDIDINASGLVACIAHELQEEASRSA